MRVLISSWPGLTALGMALALSACASNPGPRATAGAAASATAQEIDWVQTTLLQGHARSAEKQIKILLRRDPMNPRLLLLRQSLNGDPKEQLGAASYAYTVRSGDTITRLAERLLGNPLKAYQLARYNGLAVPVTLTPGQTLRIPGTPRAPAPPPAAERPSRPAPIAPPAALAPARPSPPPAAATRPTASPGANPAAAQRARAAGLAALNRGAVDEAVGLLQRAHALDSGNALISRDLARARRIAETVRSQK